MKRFLLSAAIALAVISVFAAEPLKITYFGDSYTTFLGVSSPAYNAIWYFPPGHPQRNNTDVETAEQCWWHLVTEALGAKMEINNSFSGSTISCSGYKPDNGGEYSDRSFCSRMLNLGDPDLILICGATNDSWAGAPIGDYRYEGIEKKDLYEFRPALAYLLGNMQKLYPKARIVFILNNDLKPEINESVHNICAYYGICCLDLKGIDKISGHPSVKGMKQFATQVVDYLATIGIKKQ